MADVLEPQNVPVGGQPFRKTVTLDEAQAAEAAGKDLVVPAYQAAIDALTKGMATVDGRKDKHSSTLRNHFLTYRDTLQDLLKAL